MNRRIAVLAALALAGGCKKQLTWSDKKLTTVETGPFTASIPAGWRDVSELDDDELAKRIRANLPADARAITTEATSAAGFQPTIMVNWIPVGDTAAMSCEQLAASVASNLITNTSVTASQLGDDKVCSWATAKDKATGKVTVRFHGDHYVVVECLHATNGDATTDAACAQVVSTLKLK